MRIIASVFVGIATSILCYLGMSFFDRGLLPLWYHEELFFVCLFSVLITYWALKTPFSFARIMILLFVGVLLPIYFCMLLFAMSGV
jgi:hypothetical protein